MASELIRYNVVNKFFGDQQITWEYQAEENGHWLEADGALTRIAELQSQLDALTEKMNYHEVNQLELDDLCASERIEPSPCCAPKYCALAPFHQVELLRAQLDAKWISVEERLPEATQGQVEGPFIISDDVLCYWSADGGIHEVCNYDHEDHRWSLVHKAFEEPDCEPTHWQPLPPPPSGAKGETKP